MSWDEHHRRRAAIKAVLAHAGANPADGLPYEQLPAARAQFRDRRELMLALQHDWSLAHWSRIELLSLDERHAATLTDADELARTAYADCAARHPVLRRLLDAYRDEIGPTSRVA